MKNIRPRKTIYFKGELIKVDFDYQPSEPQTRWEPGCEEDFEDISINNLPEDWFQNDIIEDLKVLLSELIKEERDEGF